MPYSSVIDGLPATASIITSLSLMLICGFLMTRLTKPLHLPNVTAYILVGILLGPSCLGLISGHMISGTDFLSDIALAFIAFGTGEYFKLSTLKKNGKKTVLIALLESCLASVFVLFVCLVLLKLDLAFSLVLAALASATAPASTVMTIRQTGASGDFVDTLLQVVALDDIVALVAYSIAISAASASKSGSFDFLSILLPILYNFGVFVLGGGFGWLMKVMMPKKRSTDNRLIISLSLIFAFCGVCSALGLSPLLGCMSMGTVYINLTEDEKLFRQLNYFTPPILLLFFVRSGLNFRLDLIAHPSGAVGSAPLLLVGVLYFLFRIGGKYAGAFLGCLAMKKAPKTRNYLGLALIPQAGVAIGLAAIGARTLGGDTGAALETIILASSVLYELIGPACAKLALWLSGSYSDKLEDIVPEEKLPDPDKKRNEVDYLIDRIRVIQSNMPPAMQYHAEAEDAFTEAAEEQYESCRLDMEERYKRRKKE